MSGVVLSLGSNLGDRLAHLRGALAHLPGVVATSAVYETDPVGGPEQGAYLNAAVLLGHGDARAALVAAQAAEAAAGRERRERWGPRTLDVDVVWAPRPVDEPDLQVPHPRAGERAFVLVPWLDVDPDARLGDVPVRELLARLGDAGVRPVGQRL